MLMIRGVYAPTSWVKSSRKWRPTPRKFRSTPNFGQPGKWGPGTLKPDETRNPEVGNAISGFYNRFAGTNEDQLYREEHELQQVLRNKFIGEEFGRLVGPSWPMFPRTKYTGHFSIPAPRSCTWPQLANLLSSMLPDCGPTGGPEGLLRFQS